jgi:hypothetical protein
MVNLEINGPGQAVWAEMQNLKRVALNTPGTNRGLLDVVMNIQNYLYKRPDSFGAPSAYHWKTTYDTKERMMNYYKDCFERGILLVSSAGLCDEMKNVVREDGTLGAPGRGKDDRVIASCLATIAWADFTRMKLVQIGETREKAISRHGQTEKSPDNVANYLRQVGITR